MTTKNAFKATYHFYLCTAVLKEMEKRDLNTGDNLGIGEDVFVTELYPYSNLLYRHVNAHTDLPNTHWKESDFYDVCDQLAAFFVDAIEQQETAPLESVMPELDEFELDIQRVLQSV
ncbi:hypothetical protein DDN26_14470 [Vibrio cholerae]|jgi:hypothetical protein|uniref:hypothetical protein n=1 Tax=Vibrio fluvialis TaxID=676 RepID=UPI0025732484|nr:hypothetical protein [Vibrio fluvialis]EGR4421462.1 hypothetical protein [Vibrio cholerae]BEI26563.1 hypothetical protein KKIDH5335_48950 [Vibrio fluvialis]